MTRRDDRHLGLLARTRRADDDDDAGTVARQPATHVERQGAYVAPGRPVDPLSDDLDTVHVMGAGRQRSRGGEHLADAVLLDLLLGGAQPLDDVTDPLGQLLGAHLQGLGQLGDEHVLARQELVGVARRPAPRPDARRSRWMTPPAA